MVPRLAREIRLGRNALGVPLLDNLDALPVDPPVRPHRVEEAQHRRACEISVREPQPEMRTLEGRRRTEQHNGARVLELVGTEILRLLKLSALLQRKVNASHGINVFSNYFAPLAPKCLTKL